MEEELRNVLGRTERPERLYETVSQCIRIAQEQQTVREEQRTGFWQCLSAVLRFEGLGTFGLHTVILLLVCVVIRSTVKIFLLPAFMPLFALAVMPLLFRSRYYGVSEIEAVTRASGAQIVLAKLVLAGAAGLVCVTILLCMGICTLHSYENIGKLALYCLVPYLAYMSVLLRIVRLSQKGSVYAQTAAVIGSGVCWSVFSCKYPAIYEASAMGFWMVLFGFFGAFFVREIYIILGMRKEGKLYGIIN